MRRGIRLKGIIRRTNRDGSARVYYRGRFGRLVRLPDLPENDPRFLEAYARAVAEVEHHRPRSHAKGRSLGALALEYTASRRFRDLAPGTKAYLRSHLKRLLASPRRADAPVEGVRPRHIRRDLEALSPAAARTRLKLWRGLMRRAIEIEWIEDDPSAGVEAPKAAGPGRHSWTTEEINRFRRHWPVGSPERLAFELVFWTGARIADAGRFGWQMIDGDGWLSFVASKNRARVELPLLCRLPAWCEALEPDRSLLEACLEARRGEMLFITRWDGAPRSTKALSGWFAACCRKAGLEPRCTAHGLRKARAAALAEIGATAHQIGAWIGDRSLSEVARYTRAAERRRIIAGDPQGGTERKRNSGTSSDPRSNFGRKAL